MRNNLFIISIIFLFPCFSFSQVATEGSEEKKIQKVIQTAYIDGLQNLGDMKKVHEGFHPGFNLLGVRNNMLTKFPIYTWAQMAETRKKENPEGVPEEEKVTCKFPMIDITGNAAVAKLKFMKGGKHVFTDYLSLYKFDEGWRIVSKIYHEHKH